jgi:uncharacterized membrane protein YfcA
MRANTLRLWLILALAVAGVTSVLANKVDSPFIGWLSFAVFLCSIALYFKWRQTAIAERRGRVFDQEAKTDEDRTRPDQ